MNGVVDDGERCKSITSLWCNG